MAGLALLLLVAANPLPVRAGEVVLTPVGSGEWQISTAGLAAVQSLDLSLRYDPQRLPDVILTTGASLGGALSALNDKVPGMIRLGVIATQPLPPSGHLLTIKAAKPGGELVVSHFEVKTSDGSGKPVKTFVRQQLLSETALPEVSGLTVKTATFSPRTLPGNVTLNEPPLPGGGRDKTPLAQLLVAQEPLRTKGGSSSPALGPSVHSGPEKRFHSQEGIVAAIDHLPRPWTVEMIKKIFLELPTATSVRQEPPVVLADGISRVSLYLPKALSKKTPTIGVQGCTLGNVWDAEEAGWQIDLVTQKGSWPATALLLGEGDLVRFPVVVVPPLSITLPARGDAALPLRDFDNDGAITAIDAYLYVGNLLAH